MIESRCRAQRCAGRPAGLAGAVFAGAVLVGACAPEVDTEESDLPWQAVQEYLDSDAAWHAKQTEIGSAEEKARWREEAGPHPDIAEAVSAARAIVASSGHQQTVAAAEFLIEHPPGLSRTAAEDIALGVDTLAARVGADWSVVRDYLDQREAWSQRSREIEDADVSDQERQARLEELGETPKILRALAAATAIAEAGHSHHKSLDAAEFLIDETSSVPGADHHVYRGATALAKHFPDYEKWPQLLMSLDYAQSGPSEHVARFFEEMATAAEDAVVRATARYFAAAGLIRSANDFSAPAEDRAGKRRQALALAAGLSAGVEDEEFVQPQGRDEGGSERFVTLAQAEADLIHRLRFTTVGGKLPEVTGKRLDGIDESLSAYAGKVVLIDFWATWCGPCVRALPKLRELHAELPPARFALLSISVDEELETVTQFQRDESMPWSNWHVGVDSDLARSWEVCTFPTYLLIDEQGVLLARTNHLSDPFKALIESAARGDVES